MAKLRIPRGTSFDLKTGNWFIAQPREPRPFFDMLRRTGSREFTTVGRSNSEAYFYIAPKDSPDANKAAERLTPEEYAALVGAKISDKVDPATFLTGNGPPIGITIINRQEMLGQNERGLILIAGIEDDGQGEVKGVEGANPDEIRSALFLWDKLDWPKSDMVDVPVSAEAQFLLDAGVMLRTSAGSHGSVHLKESLINLHELAFAYAEQTEPGRWALGHGSSILNNGSGDQTRKLLVELTGLLAVPAVNVPLEEVLEFRSKRRDELLALRGYLDEVYATVRLNPEDSYMLVSASDKLAAAAAAQRKVFAETGLVSRMSNLTLDFKLSDFGAAGSAAAAAYAATNDVLAAGKAAVLGLGVKMAAKMSSKNEAMTEFKYIISIDRQFGARALDATAPDGNA